MQAVGDEVDVPDGMNRVRMLGGVIVPPHQELFQDEEHHDAGQA
jgi:hypothetical protein